ncbi:TetR/AcrR family transcriptional regulator [Pseudonocardia ailaonensis]|uniref:TetR/AcrR family transcriptional regulator n=1 Tax=Pseudonocardia ailaonensis TaxID=367279 RepID=A0ABN2MHF1_9PSEU
MPAEERASRRRRGTPSKGDLREQAILDAAEALLDERGVDELTVEEIARGAGITRGALYFYFGSKQEVLVALVARTVAALRETARLAATEGGRDPRDSIRAALGTTAAAWREHGRTMRVAVDHSAVIPEIGAMWVEVLEENATALRGVLVRAGVPDGPGPTDAAERARALCWMTERTFYRATATGKSLDAALETCDFLWRSALPA